MDENAYGYEDDPEQPEHHPGQPEHHPGQPEHHPGQPEHYPGQPEHYPGQPEHYWHRRAAILVAGLGLISLLAWVLSPSGGKPAGAAARASQPSGSLSAAADSGAPDPSAESSPGASAAVPGLTSPGTGGASPGTATASPGRASPGSDRASGGSAASPGTGSGQRCSPGAVVLSLFSKSSYPDGRDPGFAVDAVSTAPGTCTFDLGSGHVQLVVMSAGRIIWDSADCPRGDGAQPALLSRGVPVQETITWSRAITLPGCVILASSAPSGTYEVQARAGTIASSVRTFRLAR